MLKAMLTTLRVESAFLEFIVCFSRLAKCRILFANAKLTGNVEKVFSFMKS